MREFPAVAHLDGKLDNAIRIQNVSIDSWPLILAARYHQR
jgi:hypothetical protein